MNDDIQIYYPSTLGFVLCLPWPKIMRRECRYRRHTPTWINQKQQHIQAALQRKMDKAARKWGHVAGSINTTVEQNELQHRYEILVQARTYSLESGATREDVDRCLDSLHVWHPKVHL